MNKIDLKEFNDFLKSEAIPPSHLDQQILSKIRIQLNPSLPLTVTKLLLCNAIGSIATLALCPQYGLSLTGTHGLMHYFMQIHPAFCFFVCGGLWMLGGGLLTQFFLTWDEQRILSRHYWGTAFSFILFSVLAFACLGSLTLDLWFLVWAMGAVAVMSAFGLRLRAKVNRYRQNNTVMGLR